MADMSNLLVKDDTGADVTFYPVSNANQNLVWRANVASVPIEGQPKITAVWERIKSGDWRLSYKLEVPAMETVGTASSGYQASPKVAYANVAILTIFASRRSTVTERANLVRMITHLIQGAGSVTAGGVDAKAVTASLMSGAADTLVVPNSLVQVRFPN